MQVWVEEEYGYADYIWNAPFKSREEFSTWWSLLDKSVVRKAVFGEDKPKKIGERSPHKSITERRIESYKRTFGGEWESIKYNTDFQPTIDRLHACDAYMHIHEEEDSYITLMSIPGEAP